MSATADIFIYLLVLTPILLIIGCPIGTSICVGSVLSMGAILGMNATLVSATRIYSGMNSFALIAIPFFVLAGVIMNTGGIAQKLINLAKVFIGFIPGALAHTNTVANMMFGAISGSGVAAAAAIGSVMLPIEKKEGYEPRLSAAVNIASAPSGMIIPPSNIFIIYSLASGGVSVAALFVAGYLPGILWGLAVIIVTAYYAWKLKYKAQPISGWGTRLQILIEAIPAILLIIIIIGGIRIGAFTPTEAGAVAIIYSLMLGIVYREMRFKDIIVGIKETILTSASIMLIIGAASAFAWVLTREKVPQYCTQLFIDHLNNAVIFLLIVNVFLLIVGMFIEGNAAMIILVPLLAPLAHHFGINEIQFAMVVIFNFAIGALSPPMGTLMFVTCSITKCPMGTFIKEAVPFYILLVICLLLLTFVPVFSTGLVDLIY